MKWPNYEDWEKETRTPAVTRNKDAVLQNLNPHYTDKRFRHAQTIFGSEQEGLGYVYSDRLWEWDYSKAQEATKIANESGVTPRTCRWFEAYLSAYFGKKIIIEHILAGWNLATGFPYQVFGYKEDSNG